MKLWGGESDTGCCSVADVDDARRVAQQLGIDHHVFNFGDDFDAHVVEPYVAAHAAGRTPEPVHRVQPPPQVRPPAARGPTQLGFDAVATGHHARVVPADRRLPASARGADRAKDQSYVLHMLDQAALARVRFPVGDADQGRGAGAGRRARAAHGDQARQPGRVLHHRDGGRAGVPRRRASRSRRASWSTPAAAAVGRGRRRRAGDRRPAPRPGPAAAASAATSSPSTRAAATVTVGLGRRPARRRARRCATCAWAARPGRRARCSCSAAPTARPGRRVVDGDVGARGPSRSGGSRRARAWCSTTRRRARARRRHRRLSVDASPAHASGRRRASPPGAAPAPATRCSELRAWTVGVSVVRR